MLGIYHLLCNDFLLFLSLLTVVPGIPQGGQCKITGTDYRCRVRHRDLLTDCGEQHKFVGNDEYQFDIGSNSQDVLYGSGGEIHGVAIRAVQYVLY